jgi:hypothetical protein
MYGKATGGKICPRMRFLISWTSRVRIFLQEKLGNSIFPPVTTKVLSKNTELNREFSILFPSQRRGAPFRALARGEGTNSARLFTTGKRNALAKSKVHQISWAHGYDPRVDLLTDQYAVCQEWDKHTEDIKARFQFSKAYIWKITFHTMSLEANFV